MLRKTLLFTVLVFLVGSIQAQNRLTEKALLGTWKMVIEDLEETKERMEKKHEESEESEASERLGKAIESAVSEFVSEMIGGIEIYFTFKENHEVKMEIEVMGEHETEYLKWHINDDGYLYLEDDDHDRDDDDDLWKLEDGKLVAYDRENGRLVREKDVYMIKIK